MSLEKNHILKSKKIRLGITMGDSSGIGPEILSCVLNKIKIFKDVEFVVIADAWVLYKFPIKEKNFKLIDLKNVPRKNFSFGKISPHYARASIEYLEEATRLLKNKELDCLVTLPITKESWDKSGFFWHGHTEYLADSFGVKDVTMMLMNRYIKTALVTKHLALKKVPSAITKEKICQTIISTEQGLRNWFGIKRPKIAVCALNPHASDGGLFGDEEKRIIIPSIRNVRRKIKATVEGPFPCDALFLKAKQRVYDGIIAMYHDQALIALKLSDFSHGVNITLGLPFVRTSPLHGSALDIAGKGKASYLPLWEAIRVAVNCTRYQMVSKQ